MQKTTPECYWTSSNAYPFCFGAKYPYQFAENDCYTCPWYREYLRERKMKELKELAEIKKSNIDECEIEIIKDSF